MDRRGFALVLSASLALAVACSDDSTVTADSKVIKDSGITDKSVGQDAMGTACTAGACWEYVIDRVLLPLDQTSSDKYGMTYQGKQVNNLGTLLTTLSQTMKDTDIQGSFDDQVCSGKNLLLLRMLASALTSATGTKLQMWTGEQKTCCSGTTCYDKTAKTCVTAATQTCFSGSAAFSPSASSANNMILSGAISGGKMTQGPGSLKFVVPAEAATLTIPLEGVNITGTLAGDKITDGILNGGLPVSQISSLYDPLAKIINAELKTATPATATLIKTMLDMDKDGTISKSDLEKNTVLAAMIKGDVKVKDSTGTEVDAISLGVGLTAVKAKINTK